MNRVIISGFLGKDVKLGKSESGVDYAHMTLAVRDFSSKNDDGPMWFSVTVFGRMAINCSQYLQKGSRVLVEGKLSSFNYKDSKTNESKVGLSVIADEVEFVGSKSPKNNESIPDFQLSSEEHPPTYANSGDYNDDIPF